MSYPREIAATFAVWASGFADGLFPTVELWRATRRG